MCHDSLVGKTLKGVADQTTRFDVLVVDISAGNKQKSEFFECDDGISEIKFLKLVCSNDTSADYKVDYTLTFTGTVNTFPCLASVDNNMNIRIISFGKIDLKFNLKPLPLPFPLPNVFEDILYNLDITFTKQKCKYQVSGILTASNILTIQGAISFEVNAVSSIKSGNFKLVSN